VDREDDPRDPDSYVRTDFPKPRFKLAYERHADRPAALGRLDVETYRLAVLAWQVEQPLTDRFIARCGDVEDDGQNGLLVTGFTHIDSVPLLVHMKQPDLGAFCRSNVLRMSRRS
jgi:hypothetical protein